MVKLKFLGQIKDRIFIPHDPKRYHTYLGTLEGRTVEISLDRPRVSRSNPQNKYYWGCVVTILAEHFGYTNEEMHEALKWEFLRKKNDTSPKAPFTVRSTTDLSTKEFEEHLENIRRWAVQ